MLILSGKLKCVDRLAFSPDGSRIVAAGGDCKPIELLSSTDPDVPVLLLDVCSSQNDWHFTFDPRDSTLIVADNEHLFGFDATTGEELWRVTPGEYEHLAGFALSPDGERIALGFRHQYLTHDGYQLWKRTAGQAPKQAKTTKGTDGATCIGVAMLESSKQMAFVEYGPEHGALLLCITPTTRGKRRMIETELKSVGKSSRRRTANGSRFSRRGTCRSGTSLRSTIRPRRSRSKGEWR